MYTMPTPPSQKQVNLAGSVLSFSSTSSFLLSYRESRQTQVLHDHLIHAPIGKLAAICSTQLEIFYFACKLTLFSCIQFPTKLSDFDCFRMLANSNMFKALCMIIRNMHWNDFRLSTECIPSVEEIYLMIRPTSARAIEVKHVLPWLKPEVFPSL